MNNKNVNIIKNWRYCDRLYSSYRGHGFFYFVNLAVWKSQNEKEDCLSAGTTKIRTLISCNYGVINRPRHNRRIKIILFSVINNSKAAKLAPGIHIPTFPFVRPVAPNDGPIYITFVFSPPRLSIYHQSFQSTLLSSRVYSTS